MTHPTNLREAYPDDKLLRFLFLPSEYPILYVLLRTALRSCGFANSLTQIYSAARRCYYWIDDQVCYHEGLFLWTWHWGHSRVCLDVGHGLLWNISAA